MKRCAFCGLAVGTAVAMMAGCGTSRTSSDAASASATPGCRAGGTARLAVGARRHRCSRRAAPIPRGRVTFDQQAAGVMVVVTVTGLPAGTSHGVPYPREGRLFGP